jgi:hypothetical protein
LLETDPVVQSNSVGGYYLTDKGCYILEAVMNPDSHQNLAPSTPASLPAMPNSPQPPMPGPSAMSSAEVNLAEHVNAQAKALVSQYQNDPYRLSAALQQLKSKYLADQFHISSKTAEE